MSIARNYKVFLVCLRGVVHFVGLVMMLLVYLHGIVGLYDREYDVVDAYRSEEGIVDESNSYFNLSVNLRGVVGVPGHGFHIHRSFNSISGHELVMCRCNGGHVLAS